RKRQPVMAATRSMIQHRGRFAVPFRQRVGDPANVVKVAINVQRTLWSENIADDDRFVGIHNRRSPHCDNRAADNLTYSHFDSFPVSSGSTQHLFGAPTDVEGAHRLCVGVWFPFHQIVFHVATEFLAEKISALFPKRSATRRSSEVHYHLFPTHPE